MMKTVNQMHFEQLSENLEKEMDIFSQKLGRLNAADKIYIHTETQKQLATKIKNLNNIYNKLETQIKINSKNKNYNQYDLKQKLRKYQLTKQKLQTKFESIRKQFQNLQRNYVIGRSTNNTPTGTPYHRDIELQNMNKVNELTARYYGANQDLMQTEGITQNTKTALYEQGALLNQMKNDTREAEAELSMADQMMRIIRNRNLITKLILIILIVFMGIANVLLLVVKMM